MSAATRPTAAAAWRPARSSRSGGSRRGRRRCRRGSTRRTARGRASAGRAGTARRRRRPAAGRRRRAGRAASSRRESSSATSPERHAAARAGRALDLEVVAVVVVELLQRLDQQVVDREPDRAAPVGVAAEQPGVATRPARSRTRDCLPSTSKHVRVSLVDRATARGRRTARGTRSRRACARARASAGRRRSDARAGGARRRRLAASATTSSPEVRAVLEEPLAAAAGSRAAARAAPARASRPRTAGSGRPSSGPCSGIALRRPAGAARRRRTRPPRPTAPCRRRRDVVHRVRRCRGSARRTWWRCPRRPGCRAPARARCASRFRQYIAIQLVPSACSRWPPVGSGALRSKTPMLSSPRKPPWKTLLPSASLRLTHQVKLSSSLWKTRSRNARSPLPRALAARSCRRASAAQACTGGLTSPKRPLVGGELPVRVHVPLAQQQHELLLGELGVDQRERHAVEREVPGRVPGVLPLVRHRDDVGVVEVRPLVVAAACGAPAAAAAAPGRRRASRARRSGRLLAPEQPGERLPLHAALRRRDSVGRDDRCVELVGLARRASPKHGVEVGEAAAPCCRSVEPQRARMADAAGRDRAAR